MTRHDAIDDVDSPGVHLFWADVEPLSGADENAVVAMMSPEERRRQQRFRHEPSRQCHLVTRRLLRTTLSRLAERNPASWRFGTGPWGRPFLKNPCPKLMDMDFNVAHSRHKTVLALTFEGRIGVDLEPLQRRVDHHSVAQQFFHPTEQARLQELDEEQRRLRFLQLWVLKEAWMKADGRGIGAGLSEVIYHFDDAGQPHLQALPDGDVGRWEIALHQTGDHLLALALQREDRAPREGDEE